MSHVDTEYDFLKNQCVMIFGKNETDEGSDSNGSGKSVLLEAITLATTGEVSRDVDRDEFINEDAEETNVIFHLTNVIGTVKDLVIDRTVHRTKAAKIVLKENGTINKEITSVNEANARIYELIGLTKFDLLNFFLVGQEKKFSFLTCSDTDKKDVVARFSNTDHISKKIDDLKEKSKLELKTITELNSEVGKIDSKIELLEEQISDFKANQKESNKKEIVKIEERNEKLKSSIKLTKNQNDDIDIRRKKYNKLIKTEAEVLKNQSKLELKRAKIKSKLKTSSKELSEAEILKEHLQSVLDGAITCPSCQFEFSLGADLDLSEIPNLIVLTTTEIDRLEIDIKNLKKKDKTLNSEEDEIDDSIDEIKKAKSDLINDDRKYKNNEGYISECEATLKDNEIKIKNLKNKKSDSTELTKNKNQLKSLITQKELLLEQIKPKQQYYEDCEFWIHHFGKKGFLTFLTNKSIKSIEGITNSYLKKMKTNLQLEIDGYTVLKGGGNSDKINVSIVRNGRKVAKFNRYSGGEKGRIVIANILGLQKLINMSCTNGGLNFLGLDEVFEGLDVTGQIEVTKILEEIEMTTLVVSHRSKPIGVKNELIIKKENGISFIENNLLN